ncbi:MAG: hypothetical protein ACT4N2_02250 [Hyphomicrobium sp.]
MRCLSVVAALAMVAGPAVADEKCTGEVAAAFAKQATTPQMRTIITHPAEGGAVTRTISLVRPNRLHMVTDAPQQEAGHLETISIGKWAWGSDGQDDWTEHKPNVAQMIGLDVERMAAPATVSANFTCLGKVSYEGKDWTGYRADPGPGDDGVELAATVYVDEASGLPGYNIVAPTAGDAAPRLKTVYSYGDDIVVNPPPGFGEPSGDKSGAAKDEQSGDAAATAPQQK